ncbi:ubiquitin-like-specific protease 1D [Phragmites australis]|uniref:ubiquitin-like-specific protease 1D n=1 Tax=Phragmites australis TaxID=29695 RepID=UPI002D77C7B6|nr:ubiquitin-like-specific protease 1D [Phragmites australis]
MALRWSDDVDERRKRKQRLRRLLLTACQALGKTGKAWRRRGFNGELWWPMELRAMVGARRRMIEDVDARTESTGGSSDGVGKALRDLSTAAGSRKRKAATPVNFSMRLRSRKEEVVLLDGDTTTTPHPESAEETSNNWDAEKLYYPSREHPNSVEISYDDIRCLHPESLLSSPIMNFYIMYLQEPMSPIIRPRGKYHIFNTYFFSKLEALTSKEDKTTYFLKLRRWWRGVDIFHKAYILLPLHAEFLKEEWNYLNEYVSLEEFPLRETVWKNLPRKIEKKTIEVPQQENDYDCGLFVLYYMQRFIQEAPERLQKKDLSMFGKGWFRSEEPSHLRHEIRHLLCSCGEAESKNDATELLCGEAESKSDATELTTSKHLSGS